VYQFSRVLFHVYLAYVDCFFLPVNFDVKMTVAANRGVQLRYLVGFGQVGVKIIFAVKLAVFGDVKIKRQPEPQGILHDGTVKHRQYAGHPRADRADVGIRFATVCGSTSAENF